MIAKQDGLLELIWLRLRILAALVIRETSARFGRSWGGYIWAVAEPAGGIILLAIAFGYIARVPPMGTSFMYFYASGIVPFMMYNAIANSTMHSIRANRGLLTYPVVAPLDTLVARACLDAMTFFVIALILFPAIVYIDRVDTNINSAALATTFAMVFALGLGVGTLNCVLIGFFPTWQNIWGVLNRPIFIISGVLFNFESVPTNLRNFFWYNPIAQIIAEARHGLYGVETEGFVSLPYVFGISMLLFLVGSFLMRQNEAFLLQQ